jgi:hypothetical protein
MHFADDIILSSVDRIDFVNLNGARQPENAEHMHTPLVLWGWTPGDGRTPVPMAQREFLAKVKEWAAKGAACPPETTGLQKIFESGKNLDIPHH